MRFCVRRSDACSTPTGPTGTSAEHVVRSAGVTQIAAPVAIVSLGRSNNSPSLKEGQMGAGILHFSIDGFPSHHNFCADLQRSSVNVKPPKCFKPNAIAATRTYGSCQSGSCYKHVACSCGCGESRFLPTGATPYSQKAF